MHTCYNNILIPVEPGLDIETAAVKAMEITDSANTTIHLAHFARSWDLRRILTPASPKADLSFYKTHKYINILINLIHWKNRIEKYCPGTIVKIHIRSGFSPARLFNAFIQREGPDLIIVALAPGQIQQSFDTAFPFLAAARNTQCRILYTDTIANLKQPFATQDVNILREYLTRN